MKTYTLATLALVLLSLSPPAQAQWIQTNGPYGGSITSLAVSGSNLFAATEKGVYLSTNSGTTWNAVNTGLSNTHVNALLCSPNGAGGVNLFAGTGAILDSVSGVFLSTNNGKSWTPASAGLALPWSYVETFATSPNGAGGTDLYVVDYIPRPYAPGSDRVFFSNNNGTSWKDVGTELPRFINCLAVIDSTVFAGSSAYMGGNDGGIFRSMNNGTSWVDVDSSLTHTAVLALAVSGTNLYASTYNRSNLSYDLLFSTNKGTSWSTANVGLPENTPVSAFAVSPAPGVAGDVNLFAGGWSGVFHLANDGASWTAVNAGLKDTNVSSLIAGGTNLYVAISGGGVWRRPLSEMITSVQEVAGDGLPSGFELEQNYPNPFNPSTTIKFDLPKASHVSLTVYDVLGRQVTVLVNEKRDAGIHEVKFDAAGLASGVYFYHMQAGSYTETNRLLLVK